MINFLIFFICLSCCPGFSAPPAPPIFYLNLPYGIDSSTQTTELQVEVPLVNKLSEIVIQVKYREQPEPFGSLRADFFYYKTTSFTNPYHYNQPLFLFVEDPITDNDINNGTTFIVKAVMSSVKFSKLSSGTEKLNTNSITKTTKRFFWTLLNQLGTPVAVTCKITRNDTNFILNFTLPWSLYSSAQPSYDSYTRAYN